MVERPPTPLGIAHLYLSLPLVCLGVAGLLAWHGAAPPTALPTEWHHYDLYQAAYRAMPVLGAGSVIVGLLNTGYLGWVVYAEIRGGSTDA